jgi:stage II sporulation protein E
MHFSAFLGAANEELTALRYRRQYQARLKESRGAVCRQYETLAQVLSTAATELSAELTLDPIREKKLRQHLAALDLEGETAVYYDQAGHLRAQVTGEGVPALTDPAEVEALSALLGLPLRAEREGRDRVLLLQAEPLMAVAGAAARRREGQGESGDTGTWFKREDGSLFVLLCDGMGSGQAAHRESALAVRLLEEFLRAGLEAPAALRTVNSALALKNEETGAFTTVDLLRLDLYTGQGEVYKLGAAPTYLKRRGTVSRLAGAALPAGLTGAGGPDVNPLDLAAGDWVLLISDGVADPEEDGWLRDLLTDFQGDSPKDLARLVMEESEKRVGAADDRTAVAIELRKR